MKTQIRIYALTLILAIPLFLSAQPRHRRAEASIEVINRSHRPIRVEVDGHPLATRNYDGYYRQYLRAGHHRLLVLEMPRRPYQRPRVLYDRVIRVKRGSEWTLKIDRRGRVWVRKSQGDHCPSCREPRHGAHHCQAEPYENYGYGDYYPDEAYIMSPSQFERVKAGMLRASFESSRKSIFRTALRDQMISSAMLRELLDCFHFESSRIEMARYAYPHLSDPENIALVFDSFQFESSIRSFERFLAQR